MFAAVVALGLLIAGPAAAESPVALSEELASDGVYVSRVRTEIDEVALEAAVQEVRSDGLLLVVVAPIDPEPDGESFARRIQEAVEADAALIFMPDGSIESYVIDELAPARIRATEKAEAIADPARATLAFADELTSQRTAGRPELIGQLIMALVLLGVTIGLIVAVEQAVGASRRKRIVDRSRSRVGT
ncbi:MAG: hypothetical protein OEZ14_02955 [Acidimicrobiia bacterium]|nr:hypothetical protein [Acidimicrobiia bacterium]